MELKAVNVHLTDAELFTLAAPPVGEPEPLPGHLSECFQCSRALQEWKLAVREIAAEETETLDRRTAGDWEILENETIAALRRAGTRRRASRLRWAVSIAACLLVGVLAFPVIRKSVRGADNASGRAATAAMAAQDQKDDALLRDVARLSRGEDGGSWSTLAPEPGATMTPEDEQL